MNELTFKDSMSTCHKIVTDAKGKKYLMDTSTIRPNVYGFGFSAFVDSIIIEASDYILPEEIALLDTPGYTKYDQDSDSKRVLSDRQKAFKQLSISDYLIWLIDIDSGAITEDDIQFIESLPIKTPVLIIFTKADLKCSLLFIIWCILPHITKIAKDKLFLCTHLFFIFVVHMVIA